jgi:hypothetical protein
MDIYHAWCNLKDGVRDLTFVERATRYFDHLAAEGLIGGYRITRRKLGLGPPGLPEFHLMIEVEDMAALDRLFGEVAARDEPIEGLHHGVNSLVRDVMFALYRDFPDPVRKTGQERF